MNSDKSGLQRCLSCGGGRRPLLGGTGGIGSATLQLLFVFVPKLSCCSSSSSPSLAQYSLSASSTACTASSSLPKYPLR